MSKSTRCARNDKVCTRQSIIKSCAKRRLELGVNVGLLILQREKARWIRGNKVFGNTETWSPISFSRFLPLTVQLHAVRTSFLPVGSQSILTERSSFASNYYPLRANGCFICDLEDSRFKKIVCYISK